MPTQNEEQSFLDELKQNEQKSAADFFGETEAPTEEENQDAGEIDPENAPEEVKNRRHKRLEEKLRLQREETLELAARLREKEELDRTKRESEAGEYLKSVEQIYGTDSPEAEKATEILKAALKGVEERATTRALDQFREEQKRRDAEVAEREGELDSMIEEIEDDYGVTFTPEMQKGFFTLLEKMSPKDRQTGQIKEYADHYAVWDVYKDKLKKPKDSVSKELASRSMTAGGASQKSNLQDDASVRFLRENGII